MAAATPLETQLVKLLTDTKSQLTMLKKGWYNPNTFSSIQTATQTTKTLAAQIDGDARERLDEIIQKIQRKLEFSERIIKFLTEEPKTLDPRVEKIVGKINQQPLPNHLHELAKGQARLTKWQERLEHIALAAPNEVTAKALQKARPIVKGLSLICEIKKEKAALFPEPSLKQDPVTKNYTVPRCQSPIVFDVVNEATAIEPVAREKMASFLLSLQKIIESLSRKSGDGFFQALESTVNCMEFSPADREEKNFIQKICAHLYSIQNKETPEKIDRKDHFWEVRAFLSDHLSTQDQKLRAGQRLQVETLLKLIHLAFEREGNEQMGQLVDALEKIQLNANDLPPGKKNAAHYLFEALYHAHADAQKGELSLQNPDDQNFKSNFGREAFQGLVKIPLWIQRKAYKEVFEAFQKTWE